jgi:hypothetical protein
LVARSAKVGVLKWMLDSWGGFTFRDLIPTELKIRGRGLAVAPVRDLRSYRPAASPEGLEQFEIDVLAEPVLARSSAERAHSTS